MNNEEMRKTILNETQVVYSADFRNTQLNLDLDLEVAN